MALLQPKQSVTVTLDGADERFPCYVRALGGAITTLGQMGGIDKDLNDKLTPGALGYLTWRGPDGGRVSLRGVATTSTDVGPGFAFVAVEALDLLERRRERRLALAAVARFRELDRHGLAEETVIESVTVDISSGGALVEVRDGLEVGARFALDLVFDGFPASVSCEALVLREAGANVGLKFTAIDERYRARLAVLLAHFRRQAQPA